MPDNAATIGRCIWIFATLGPLFGYVTGVTLMALESAHNAFDVLRIPLAVVLAAPFGVVMAWLVGLVPAILTGVVYWALRSRAAVRVPAALALSAIAAGIACVGNAALVFNESTNLLDADSWRMMFLPAIVAILGCAAVIERGSKKAPETRE